MEKNKPNVFLKLLTEKENKKKLLNATNWARKTTNVLKKRMKMKRKYRNCFLYTITKKKKQKS